MMTSEQAKGKFNVFVFQRRALSILMGWAVGSVLAGWLWWRSGSDWWRGLGSQFAGWGLIDGIIAWFGLNGAARNESRLASGAIGQLEHDRQARNFERLLWVNSALDVSYLLGGRWLVRHYADDEGRRAMGWGIIIQATFLLIFDLCLAWLVRVRRNVS